MSQSRKRHWDDAGEIVALYIGELHLAQANLILSRVQSVDRHELGLSEARRSIAAGLGRLAENTED